MGFRIDWGQRSEPQPAYRCITNQSGSRLRASNVTAPEGVSKNRPLPVIPAKAGTQRLQAPEVQGHWVPAFAGTTSGEMGRSRYFVAALGLGCPWALPVLDLGRGELTVDDCRGYSDCIASRCAAATNSRPKPINDRATAGSPGCVRCRRLPPSACWAADARHRRRR